MSAEAVKAYVHALAQPSDESAAAAAEHLADDVASVGPMGAQTGRQAVLEALSNPQAAAFLAQATWSDPEPDGSAFSVRATLPAGMPLAGLAFTLRFDDAGRIARIEQQMIAAPPPPPAELRLGEDIASAVNGALANLTPVLVVYVDGAGSPHVSFRGTTQVLDETRMAVWVRDPEGGMLRAIQTNPNVALFYNDPKTRTTYQFAGRAHRAEDEQTRAAVYANSPEQERNFDAGMRGAAVVIDLDRVEGRGPGGPVRMARA